MAKLKIVKDVVALAKIDKEIKAAKESFHRIMDRKETRRDKVKASYIVTLDKEEYEAIYELIGNLSGDVAKKLGLTQKQDNDLYSLYLDLERT